MPEEWKDQRNRVAIEAKGDVQIKHEQNMFLEMPDETVLNVLETLSKAREDTKLLEVEPNGKDEETKG